MTGKNLTTPEYWTDMNASEMQAGLSSPARHPIAEFFPILDAFIERGDSCIELGCIPGRALAMMAERYDLAPHGIDFSPLVHDVARSFRARYPETLFWCADIRDHRIDRTFGIVLSMGFIEHFSDWRRIVALHAALARPGGLVVITAPNLSRLRTFFWKAFDPELLAIHEPEATNRRGIEGALKDAGCEILASGYFGASDFWYQHAAPNRILAIVRACARLCLVALGRLCRYPRSFWSPYIYVIARTKA